MTKMTQKPNDSLHALGAFDAHNLLGEIELLASTYGSECDELLLQVCNSQLAKKNVDAAASSIAISVRSNALRRGEKITDKSVAFEIESSVVWQNAKTVYDEVELEVERQKLALKTIDKKERALELTARFRIKELGVNASTQT